MESKLLKNIWNLIKIMKRKYSQKNEKKKMESKQWKTVQKNKKSENTKIIKKKKKHGAETLKCKIIKK